MNVQTDFRMDKPAFLAWVQEREDRYELDDGHVLMMTGGSRGHERVVRRLAAALEARLDADRWEVLTSNFAVDLGPKTVRYPDVVVDSAHGSDKDLTAATPTLIAEVISPSSIADDLGDKAAQYLQLSTLAAYVVLAQDEPKAWIWVRGSAGFRPGPEIVSEGGIIRIPSLGIELPLTEIYRPAKKA